MYKVLALMAAVALAGCANPSDTTDSVSCPSEYGEDFDQTMAAVRESSGKGFA